MSTLRASRLVLVTSAGRPYCSGLPPPLSSMDNLPEVVEVYRILPSPPPGHLGRAFSSGPPLSLGGSSPDPFQVGKRTVYVHLHCHSGYSPLHSALGVGVYRISLCVLRTHDHVTWVPTLYHGEIPSTDTRPTSRTLLLAGVLRGLWETDPEADVRDLDIYLPDQSLVNSFRAPPATFSNEVVECLFEAAHLHLTSSRRLCYATTPADLTSSSLSGSALGMALASAYAISGLSQTELCATTYGTQFREAPIQDLPLADCIPVDFFLNRWVWADLSTESILLVPLEARVLDVKRLEAQLARDRDRASRQYPPRWQDVTLRFASKVLNLSSKSVGARGHYERLLHERHWTVGHNSCKGAKTDTERASLLTCQLCVSDANAADDTYDHTFRLCQHPFLCQARAESDALLLTTPLLTELDRRLFPALLQLVQEEDGHRICLGNWNTSQITQLDQVIQPTDSVQALSESLLALSKHLVNRIDVIWAARQQAAYHTALSSTPEADPVLLRTLQRRCFRRYTSTAPAPSEFYAVRLGHVPGIYTSWREAQPQTVGIPADVKRFSTRKKAEEYMAKSTGPGDPRFDAPLAFLFTDGSALPTGSAGWGVHITSPGAALSLIHI